MSIKRLVDSAIPYPAVFVASFVLLAFACAGSLLAAGSRESSQSSDNDSTQLAPTKVQSHSDSAPSSNARATPPVGPSDAAVSVAEDIQSAFHAVAEKVLPVVVEINVTDVVQQQVPQLNSPFDYFFGGQGQQPYTRRGLGSGVIVRQSGNKVYVLTNNHVAGNAETITVTLYDGRSHAATLVGSDRRKDLALISFETKDTVPVADLGNSNTLQVGDFVLAVGNPLGYESTVTAGIISALGRRSPAQDGTASGVSFIQTDAAINEGNSGGALANIEGQVVGLNTWIVSPTGGNVGLGFAIPINDAKSAIDDFISQGRIGYGWLGVTVGDPATSTAQDLGLAKQTGGFVYGIVPGSPADKAGLLPGDFITGIDNRDLKNAAELSRTIGDGRPGSAFSLELIRSGRRVNLKVAVASRPDTQTLVVWPGMIVQDIAESILQRLPRDYGFVVVGRADTSGYAATAGIREGDIIRKINGSDINSVKEFYRELNAANTNTFRFTINRGVSQFVVEIRK